MTRFFYSKMTNLIQFTMNVRNSPPPPTFPYVGSSTQNAKDQSASCIHFLFFNSSLLPTPTDKILTNFNARLIQLYLSNHSEIDIYLIFCKKKKGQLTECQFRRRSKNNRILMKLILYCKLTTVYSRI